MKSILFLNKQESGYFNLYKKFIDESGYLEFFTEKIDYSDKRKRVQIPEKVLKDESLDDK